jgi:predicted TIM-barrel fold metal-dependent hydrolase
LLYYGGIWPRFMAEVGVEKVLFGSDYPLNNYPQAGPDAEMCRLLDEVRRAGLSDEERAALFWENGRRLVGCEI